MEKKKVQEYFISSLEKSKTLPEHFHHLDLKYKDREIFKFIDSNGKEESGISVKELDNEAQKIAKYFKSLGINSGDRILLLLNPGRDFIFGFFGCLYGGFIAVPAYPPMTEKHMEKVLTIGKDCNISTILLSDEFYKLIQKDIPEMESMINLGKLNWISLNKVEDLKEVEWKLNSDLTKDSIAFLQYTSGESFLFNFLRLHWRP
jgi:acyl-CoA synthetase (AMP-forming)/AMP-acid ligase II